MEQVSKGHVTSLFSQSAKMTLCAIPQGLKERLVASYVRKTGITPVPPISVQLATVTYASSTYHYAVLSDKSGLLDVYYVDDATHFHWAEYYPACIKARFYAIN